MTVNTASTGTAPELNDTSDVAQLIESEKRSRAIARWTVRGLAPAHLTTILAEARTSSGKSCDALNDYLAKLFDFQRCSGNDRLQELLTAETPEGRLEQFRSAIRTHVVPALDDPDSQDLSMRQRVVVHLDILGSVTAADVLETVAA